MADKYPPKLPLSPNVPEWVRFKFKSPKNGNNNDGDPYWLWGGLTRLSDGQDYSWFAPSEEFSDMIEDFLKKASVAGLPSTLAICQFTQPGTKRQFFAVGIKLDEDSLYVDWFPAVWVANGEDGRVENTVEAPKFFYDFVKEGITSIGSRPANKAPVSDERQTGGGRTSLVSKSIPVEPVNRLQVDKQKIVEAAKSNLPEYKEILQQLSSAILLQYKGFVETAFEEMIEAQHVATGSPKSEQAQQAAKLKADIYAAALKMLENSNSLVATGFIQLMSERTIYDR